MKKSCIAILLAVILSFALFSFCGCDNVKMFTLTVIGEGDILLEQPNKSYAAGETVTIKTNFISGYNIIATVDGTPLQYTTVSENGEYTHCELTFTMPNKNSTLELRTESMLLPPPMGIKNAIAYYDFNFTCDSHFVGFTMNAYVQSLQTWEQIKLLTPNFTSNYDEQFFEQNALLVLFGAKGSGARCQIESVNVALDNATLYVTIYTDKPSGDYGVAAVETEWVVVLEIENNISFSNIEVNADLY